MTDPDSEEEKLEARELLYRFAAQTSELMTVVDREGRLLYVNAVCERIFGIPHQELEGMLAFDLLHDDDRARTIEAFHYWLEHLEEAPFSIENRQVSRTGEVTRTLWTVMPFFHGDVLRGFTSSARDVTLERIATEQLRKSEVRSRALMDGMLDAMLSINPRGIILEASASTKRLFGYESSELVGQNINILMPEPHHSKHDGYLEHYAKTGDTWILNSTRTFEIVHKSGDLLWFELSVSRVDVPGEPEPIFSGSFRDVTDKVRAEEARRESERRLRAVFDQEYEFVGLLDCEGIVMDVNRAALEASGEQLEDVIGRPFWKTRWWSRDEAIIERVRKGIESAANGEFVRFETEFFGKDGHIRTVDFSLKPIFDENDEVVMLIPEGRDITELKQAQQREVAMLRALATIGESAAVLAHEIKNPITAVNLALRAVADKLGSDQAEILEDLVSRMQRLEKLMRRTLAFTKPLELQLERVNPRALLEEAAEALRPEIEDKEFKVKVSVKKNCRDVNVDSSLIEEVLLNLLRNAIDAHETGGLVHMSAASAARDRVRIRVEDDGPGMSESTLESLFRPFFTTKAQGTGLGLAICRKVIEEHGGTISAGKSKLGGASFEILLPAAPV